LFEQGDWEGVQCKNPNCSDRRVLPSKPLIDDLMKDVDFATTSLPSASHVPACQTCKQQTMFGNVRGGSWFAHSPHDQTQDALVAWLEVRLFLEPLRRH
jgi:hypothetical protein